ncbi:hypothetical protein FNW02_34975 [Komarekiella sp. 'clone 1']|uniref:Uncharacterized protein n=1 Tax=Komarekiella delphini-convector SJRDD-AB1 TaxID=2593771 RepID=A0AA40T535_9NOST|nr:hypothetical protein [Komarekiella delphini-convector]MBD6620818.1 hypothetical protein [Komarekiella delphini-convector SJRDD-AB1]
MTKFESRRITISHFAAAKVCKLLNMPIDCKPQTLASAVEQLIFELGSPSVSTEEKAANSHQSKFS